MSTASGVYAGYRKNIVDVICWITGFPKNGIASGTFYLYITIFELKICISSGGIFAYSNF